MHISISERLKPFCHLPGISTILPGWGCQVQIFPCLIRLYTLKTSFSRLLAEFSLGLKGPVQEFTVCNDLEKGCLTVSGRTSEGWMRYHLISAAETEGIRLFVERSPVDGFSISEGNRNHLLYDKEWMDLLESKIDFEPYRIPICDRLSLGNHKAQDWELMKRRFDLTEILPLIHRLGQLIPPLRIPTGIREGTLAFLEECRQTVESERPEKGEERWRNFLRVCFTNLLVPQLKDSDYQGIIKDSSQISQDLSSLVLLSEGARCIRELFVRQEQEKVKILPYLLPSLHCGRLVNVSLEGGSKLDLEWSKKSIRRLIFYAGEDQECMFTFRSDVKSYRLRQKGQEEERKSCHLPVFLKKKCYYLFDNFQ